MLEKKLTSAGLAILLCFVALNYARAAGSERTEVKASDTARSKELLENQKIEAMLADGTYLRGKVKEVKEDAMIVQVKNYEGPSALTKGEHRMPVSKFSTIKLTQYKGKKRALLGMGLGFGGLGLGILIAATEFAGESWNETYSGITTATTIGGIAGGYLLGRHLDRKEATIVIK